MGIAIRTVDVEVGLPPLDEARRFAAGTVAVAISPLIASFAA